MAEDSFGLDAEELVVVMARQGDTVTLTRNQVVDIFLGRLQQLPDGRRIIPLDQAEQSEARERFYREVLERTPAQVRAHWARLVFTGRGSPPRSVALPESVVGAIHEDSRVIAYLYRRDLDASLAVVFD